MEVQVGPLKLDRDHQQQINLCTPEFTFHLHIFLLNCLLYYYWNLVTICTGFGLTRQE